MVTISHFDCECTTWLEHLIGDVEVIKFAS
jgi:hypothetical protein